MKDVIIIFPICLQTLFLKDFEDVKKTKKNEKLPGYEIISIQKKQKGLEIKVPVHIHGLNYHKQPFFVFLLPERVLDPNYKKDPIKFFQYGYCRIEGSSNFRKCDFLLFNGNYEKETTSLVGTINLDHSPDFGWN